MQNENNKSTLQQGNPIFSLSAIAIAARKMNFDSTGVERALDTLNQSSASSSSASSSSTSSSSSSSSSSAPVSAHPYFSYYGQLIHQQNMLQDLVRTTAYHDAVTRNRKDFEGKVVIDVGTGSGILAWFAVKAGAKRVYAIEASSAAERAAQLMEANGLSEKIIVIREPIESVTIPEKVDIIISEPMGFMLVHERMLESYIIARDRFLRPGGKMFPATGSIYIAPFSDSAIYADQKAKASFWNTNDFFGLDLSSLTSAALDDHFSQPIVGFIDPSSLLSTHTLAKTINFEKDRADSLRCIDLQSEFVASKTGLCHGLAAWFDVAFDGSEERIVLDTGPNSPGTHWYQCRILLREPIAVNEGQRLSATLRMVGNDRYSYDLTLTIALPGTERAMAFSSSTNDATTASKLQPIQSSVRANLHDQSYSYIGWTPNK
jgi:histone-arginine methyltransferase CARM1